MRPAARAAAFSSLTALACLTTLVFVTAGCGRKGDPVKASLDAIEKAAGKRDAAGVLEFVANDFEGAGGEARAEIEANLKRYFAAYEGLTVTVRDLSIERSGGVAIARFRADMAGKPRSFGGLADLLPRAASYRFETRLSPDEKGRWRVYKAAWQALE